MANPVEQIGEIAVSVIMLLVLLFVLATLAGIDPSSLNGILNAAVSLVAYLTVLAIVAALVFAILSEAV